jgi:4'-phosphopantetheinyl transferase
MQSGEVRCWRTGLDVDGDRAAALFALLSSDECARAERFAFARDRRRYVIGRAQLRRVLGSYLDMAPAEIVFEYGTYGKPGIRGSAVRFNLSHSRDLMCVALATEREVGCDIEAMRTDIDVIALAKHAFDDETVSRILSAPPAARVPEFYELWTRTEALLKARGEGLGGLTKRPIADPAWTVANIPFATGYAAAVAVAGPGLDIVMRDFEC